MEVKCITNNHGFSMLTVEVSIASDEVDYFPLRAVIDTGASVSLISPALIERLRPSASNREITAIGVNGPSKKPMYHFRAKIGPTYERPYCDAVPMAGTFLGYDLVIGLDILLETGLILSPTGSHKLDI